MRPGKPGSRSLKSRGRLGLRRWRRSRPVPAALACLAAGAVLALPDLLRIDGWTPFAQLAAFRPQVVAVLLLAGMLGALSRRLRVAGLAVTLAALAGGALVLPRALDTAGQAPGSGGAALSVLVANVAVAGASIEELARVVNRRQPDLVVLPEADRGFRADLQAATEARYRGRSLQSQRSAISATSLLVSPNLGQVRIRGAAGSHFPALTASGGRLGRLRVVGIHAVPPLPFATSRWRQDLARVRGWCAASGATLIAGDFNATLDHGRLRRSLRGCSDVAAELGRGLHGTWPSFLPALLTPRLDHVLVSDSLEPLRVTSIRLDGSDHRAILARVAVPG